MTEIVLKEEVYAIIGAAMEVHRTLGLGFLEAVYHEALEIELSQRRIPFVSQPPLHVYYKGVVLQKFYVPDLIVYDAILVELKALHALTGHEVAQLLNYLKASGLKVGLLINFGAGTRLQWKRFVY